jgi:hypothetical protein
MTNRISALGSGLTEHFNNTSLLLQISQKTIGNIKNPCEYRSSLFQVFAMNKKVSWKIAGTIRIQARTAYKLMFR